MIQRIQTLYLFIASVIMVLTAKLPLLKGINDFELTAFTLHFSGTLAKTYPVFPLGIIALLSAFISFVAIFFFKNNKARLIQVRLATFSMILDLGFYLALIFYIFILDLCKQGLCDYQISLILPLIAAILTFMAIRQIKKDIEKIKSLDRIR